VVDTNVRRWLLRRFHVADASRPLQELADALATAMPDSRHDAWTHATMEFGATVCRPRRPVCETCPIARGCPSRGRAARVAVPRQPPLRGSDREMRGAIVRRLSQADGHRLPVHELGAGGEDGERWERVLVGLERDGLVQRHDGVVRLGAATIGA
jgi:A/G-specific adenine glycosylase